MKKQRKKSQFRQSAKWKKFRVFQKALYDGKDPITQRPLLAGFNVHHMDLNENNYEDIRDPSHFIPLNRATHKMLHWLYVYYKDDPEILDRLSYYLKRMKEINE